MVCIREIASDFPYANRIVPSAKACQQAFADGTPKRGQVKDQMSMQISSAPCR
jgi:hypothetical protein